MKVIVAGSREITDKERIFNTLDALQQTRYPRKIDELLSGSAKGVDKIGEEWAAMRGIPFYKYPANWEEHGLSAGYKRNQEMANNADCLVAFWDSKSKGTKHMIDIALKDGLEVHVYRL